MLVIGTVGTLARVITLVPGRRALALIAAVALAVVMGPSTASAHTDVDFTLPADGASTSSPIDEVTVAFTSPVDLVGNGFEALDPQGKVVQPPVVSDDGQVFRLQFDPPLAGGAAGVRWEVRADDGHVLTGSISFVVDAAAPTTAPATTPPTTVPAPPPSTSVVEPSTPEPSSTTTAVSDGVSASGADSTTTEPSIAVAPSAADTVADDSGNGSSIGLIVVIAAAIAIAIAGFFVIRSRASATP